MNQGLTLMLVGMGTVFVFLTLLVCAMSMMAIVVRQFTPVVIDNDPTDEEIAAISAAIALHRNKKQ